MDQPKMRYANSAKGRLRIVIDVPQQVRNAALATGNSAWLEDLPAIVASLEADWSITIGRTLTGGHEAFVAEATGADGSPCVLKVLVPRTDEVGQHEITALRLANGEGCVLLLRDDPARAAMLLERLGRSLFELRLPLPQRLEILCVTAMAVWRPARGSGLPTGAEKGRWLIDFITSIWEELDRPCSERAVAYALACAERRIAAHDDERSVLVHGDVHQLNALEAGAGFKLVDPDGLLAEAEYDMGILMRGDPEELMHGDPYDRARWLAARTGLDATAIWEWGVVERVSTGLWCTKLDMQSLARETLAVAERVAE
jgi:streptomycin 6-kinase